MFKSKLKLIQLMIISISFIWLDLLFGQITKDWYYEASIMASGEHYLYNKSENLCWGEAYHQNAFLDLWETSKDTAWLDEMVVRLDGQMGTLWDAPPIEVPCNREVYEDGYLGWGSTYYDPNGYYQEYMVHDGMIMVPIARFIRYVYNDSALYHKYGSKADAYLSTIESNIIAKWHANWDGDVGKSGLELENWGGWEPIPNNQYIIFGAAMVILYEISANEKYTPEEQSFPEFYLQESTAMANYFKGFMTHKQPEDAYLWGYWWTYPSAEHISYGYMEMIFVLEAFSKGIVFDTFDMERYTNTFTELMWNGSFQSPAISAYIDGTGPNEGYFSWTWTSLAEFDLLVWEIVHAYHQKNYSSRRKEGISRLALTTQLFDSYAPAAPGSPTITFTGSRYDLSWTAPVTDDEGPRLTGLAGYNVYRSEEPGGPYSKVNEDVIQTNFYPNIDSSYHYVVTAVDYHRPPNESPYSDIISSLENVRNEFIPIEYALQNYPNPFNPGTLINYTIAGNGKDHISIKIYDISGKLVRTVVDDYKNPGHYQIYWNGRNMLNEALSSGVYIAVLSAGPNISMKKMTMIK
jgi:hypothetical protein